MGGLINSQKLYPFMYKGNIDSTKGNSLKSLFETGFYYLFATRETVTSEMEFPPFSGEYIYGVLEIVAAGDLVAQRITVGGAIYSRFGTKNKFNTTVVPWGKIIA